MAVYNDPYQEKRRLWWDKCHGFVFAADYKRAMAFAKAGQKLFPGDVIVEFLYYSIRADYLSGQKKTDQKVINQNLSKMKTFLKRTKGLPLWAKLHIKNEYYFQSKQFKKQYELGLSAFKKTKSKYQLYSSGVGAAQYAYELAKRGQRARSKAWAKKAIEAWDGYFEVDKKYYNPYVHRALAYGVLGEEKKMVLSLKQASKLSGRAMSYTEFQQVIRAIDSLVK